MKTKTDIVDGEQLTITLKLTDVIEIDKGSLARKVLFEDADGASVPLVMFESNDCAAYEWDRGSWYTLTAAKGNYYDPWNELQLVPSWDFEIERLDEAPEAANDTGPPVDIGSDEGTDDEFVPASSMRKTEQPTADGGNALTAQLLAPGNYLLHFPLGDLSTLDVYAYDLDVPGGLDLTDDDVQNGALGFTARVAANYRYRSGAPVTTNGPLSLYAVEELTDELSVGDYTVSPERRGTETLAAQSFDDREPLCELVKQDLKSALDGSYEVNAINSIVEHSPYFSAPSGDFTASREYKCRVWVDPDGTGLCGVDVGFHLASTFSAAEYVRRGYDIEGVRVEHDTEVYANSATGTVAELADTGYTDRVPEMGSSIAAYHRDHGYVEPAVIDSLTAGDPTMARIDYGPATGLQALDLCRVVPSLDQVKRVDADFHSQFQRRTRLTPKQRFSAASSFVESIGTTPALGLTPEARPVNDCYSELAVNTGTNNLRFRADRTASYGLRGLNDYGIYHRPESFDLLAVYPDQQEEESQEFLRLLITTLNEYGADPTSLDQEAYTLGSEFEYTHVASDAAEYDGVVAVVPDPDWLAQYPDIADPYPEFKRQWGQAKVPSQMVLVSNLDEERYQANIASGLVAKCGGIPWRIHDVPGDTDVFIGLDVTYDPDTGLHRGASANVVLADGTILASQTVSLQAGETFEVDDVVDIIKTLLKVYASEENRSPNHIVIHRDGQFYLDVDDLVDRLDRGGDLIPKVDLVEIRKSGNPRIANYTGDAFEVANKGTGFVSNHTDHAYLATTGKPERLPGTPQPIQLIKRHGSTDLQTLTRQAYWLSEAHVGSVSRSTRLPITTYYADLCADHARKGYLLNGELIRGVPYV